MNSPTFPTRAADPDVWEAQCEEEILLIEEEADEERLPFGPLSGQDSASESELPVHFSESKTP